uniref:Aprataxin n=1 Tax=Cacopsylla melanoneura TaxID=428564 RepID=A0A8D8TEV7_9HEMI
MKYHWLILTCYLIKSMVAKYKQPNPDKYFMALHVAMLEQNLIEYQDENLTIIDDWYPKGSNHYIVISKRYIRSIRHVNSSHIPLLEEMEQKGLWVARSFRSRRRYLVGYHAEPFFDRLHLHIVSEDLRGRGLKNKEHYNSFTTPFFMPSKDVINSLRVNGSLHFPAHEQCRLWLKRPLYCTHCNYQPKSIHDYKDKHVAYHNFDTWSPPANVSRVPTGYWIAKQWTFFEEWGDITATPE